MNKHKLQTTFMNIGASSLLVIFIVLCIAIFATLSLSSAKSDYSFSENMAQHKTDYYDASNRSEQMLDDIDAILAEAASTSSGAQDFYQKAVAALRQMHFNVPITIDDSGGAPVLSWQAAIDDTQALTVTLQLQWPSAQEQTSGYYAIQSWQTTASE